MVTSIENGMRVITVILNADGSDKNQNTRFEQQIVCWTMWL
ncbi:D-alanyl-D-alanine serine-type carboxypeptidase domain protein, partial [Streptococcus pyogenes SS1447]